MNKIGNRITECREALKLNRAQLAVNSSLTAAAITQFEKNDRTPSMESLSKLADALNVSVDYLFGRESKKEIQADPKTLAMFRGLNELSSADKDFILKTYEHLKNKSKPDD